MGSPHHPRVVTPRSGLAPPRLSMSDRAALRKLKYAKLVERAEDAEVSEDDLAAAEDADDPNEAVIELLLAALAPPPPAPEPEPEEPAPGPDGEPEPEKPGAAPQPPSGADPAAIEAALRDELGGLRAGALRTRAGASGVPEADTAAAEDSDAPKAALVALLVAAELPAAVAEAAEKAAAAGALAALAEELAGLRVRELLKRAKASGAPDTAVAAAEDSDAPKAALVELLNKHEGAAAVDAAATAARGAARAAELRAEVAGLKMADLVARVKAAGAPDAEVAAAEDSDAPKSALIALVLAAEISAEETAAQAVGVPGEDDLDAWVQMHLQAPSLAAKLKAAGFTTASGLKDALTALGDGEMLIGTGEVSPQENERLKQAVVDEAAMPPGLLEAMKKDKAAGGAPAGLSRMHPCKCMPGTPHTCGQKPPSGGAALQQGTLLYPTVQPLPSAGGMVAGEHPPAPVKMQCQPTPPPLCRRS